MEKLDQGNFEFPGLPDREIQRNTFFLITEHLNYISAYWHGFRKEIKRILRKAKKSRFWNPLGRFRLVDVQPIFSHRNNFQIVRADLVFLGK